MWHFITHSWTRYFQASVLSVSFNRGYWWLIGPGYLIAYWSGIVGMCSNIFVCLLLLNNVASFPGTLHSLLLDFFSTLMSSRICAWSDLICLQGKQWLRTIFHEQKENLLASSHEKIPFLKCSNLQMIVTYYLLTTSCVLSAIKNKE